jgi:hypothetical protein
MCAEQTGLRIMRVMGSCSKFQASDVSKNLHARIIMVAELGGQLGNTSVQCTRHASAYYRQ